MDVDVCMDQFSLAAYQIPNHLKPYIYKQIKWKKYYWQTNENYLLLKTADKICFIIVLLFN